MMLNKLKTIAVEKKNMLMCAPVAVATSMALPIVSFAAEGGDTSLDVTNALQTSFQSMANTMLATIAATLPVVMSVMSAYLCINYGIKFFKKFSQQ